MAMATKMTMTMTMTMRRLFLVFCSALAAGPAWAQTGAPPVVFVDVGHYREKPGATSARGVTELEFNRALAQQAISALADGGARLVSSLGDSDVPDLRQRTALAEAIGAQLLISLHHDSVQPRYLSEWTWQGQLRLHSEHSSGFSLFISRKNPQPAQSLACASAIGHAFRESGFSINTQHEDPATGENREWADRSNGVFYYDNLLVLKTAAMPALLIEAGVIVNRDEELRLAEPDTRKRIAAAIRRGVAACGY